MRLARTTTLIAFLVLFLAIAAAWVRSEFWFDAIDWPRMVDVRREPSIPEGQPGAWVCHDIEWRLVSREGVLSVARLQVEDKDTSADPLRTQWSQRGLHWESADLSKIGRTDWTAYWRGPRQWRIAGLSVNVSGLQGSNINHADIPYWLLLVLTATPLAGAVARARVRRRRTAKSQCPSCGYPASGSDRCAECGTALKRATA